MVATFKRRCFAEASDVLKNLRLFDQLKLDKDAYVTIIDALLILKRHDQIPIILDEMRQAGISTDINESTKLRYLLKQCRNRTVMNNDHIHQPSNPTALMDSVLTSVMLPQAVAKLNNAVAKQDFIAASPFAIELLEMEPFPPNVALENICMTMFETNRLDVIDMLLLRLQQVISVCCNFRADSFYIYIYIYVRHVALSIGQWVETKYFTNT
jgi:hypothetical protein